MAGRPSMCIHVSTSAYKYVFVGIRGMSH